MDDHQQPSADTSQTTILNNSTTCPLPNDVLFFIFDCLDTRTLKNVRLIDRLCHCLATPLLFYQVTLYLNMPSVIKLNQISECNKLAPLVKKIALESYDRDTVLYLLERLLIQPIDGRTRAEVTDDLLRALDPRKWDCYERDIDRDISTRLGTALRGLPNVRSAEVSNIPWAEQLEEYTLDMENVPNNLDTIKLLFDLAKQLPQIDDFQLYISGRTHGSHPYYAGRDLDWPFKLWSTELLNCLTSLEINFNSTMFPSQMSALRVSLPHATQLRELYINLNSGLFLREVTEPFWEFLRLPRLTDLYLYDGFLQYPALNKLLMHHSTSLESVSLVCVRVCQFTEFELDSIEGWDKICDALKYAGLERVDIVIDSQIHSMFAIRLANQHWYDALTNYILRDGLRPSFDWRRFRVGDVFSATEQRQRLALKVFHEPDYGYDILEYVSEE